MRHIQLSAMFADQSSLEIATIVSDYIMELAQEISTLSQYCKERYEELHIQHNDDLIAAEALCNLDSKDPAFFTISTLYRVAISENRKIAALVLIGDAGDRVRVDFKAPASILVPLQ